MTLVYSDSQWNYCPGSMDRKFKEYCFELALGDAVLIVSISPVEWGGRILRAVYGICLRTSGRETSSRSSGSGLQRAILSGVINITAMTFQISF